MAKDKATPSTSSATTSEPIEDDGELKLTGNVFQVMDEQNASHPYTVTLESVLMGKAKGLLRTCIQNGILVIASKSCTIHMCTCTCTCTCSYTVTFLIASQ